MFRVHHSSTLLLTTARRGTLDDADPPVTTGEEAPVNVNLLSLDGEFDVVYNKPGNTQTVTLELDDPDSGVSLDRSNYSQNTDVVVTIDHQSLNVDPTSEDAWFLIVGASPRHLGAGDADNIKTIAEAEAKRDGDIDRCLDQIYHGHRRRRNQAGQTSRPQREPQMPQGQSLSAMPKA